MAAMAALARAVAEFHGAGGVGRRAQLPDRLARKRRAAPDGRRTLELTNCAASVLIALPATRHR
jgi:hypothetical protein